MISNANKELEETNFKHVKVDIKNTIVLSTNSGDIWTYEHIISGINIFVPNEMGTNQKEVNERKQIYCFLIKLD